MKNKNDSTNLFCLVNNHTIINLNNLVLMSIKGNNYHLQFTNGEIVDLIIDDKSTFLWNYLNSIAFRLKDIA